MSVALSNLAGVQDVEIIIRTNGSPVTDIRPRLFARLLKHPLRALRFLKVQVELFVRPESWEAYAGDYLDFDVVDSLLGDASSAMRQSRFFEEFTLTTRWRSDKVPEGWLPKPPQEFEPPLFPRLRDSGKFQLVNNPYN